MIIDRHYGGFNKSMDTDKYNPMKKEYFNDFSTSSTNSEPAEVGAHNQVEGGMLQPDDWPAHAARSMPALDEVPVHAARSTPAADDANNHAPVSQHGFNHWQDSARVMRLSAYLRAHYDAHIRLCKSDGHPSLVFDPPLSLADMHTLLRLRNRWSVALDAIDLAHAAAHDLKILMFNGLIDLPEHTGPMKEKAHAEQNVANQGAQTTTPEPID